MDVGKGDDGAMRMFTGMGPSLAQPWFRGRVGVAEIELPADIRDQEGRDWFLGKCYI